MKTFILSYPRTPVDCLLSDILVALEFYRDHYHEPEGTRAGRLFAEVSRAVDEARSSLLDLPDSLREGGEA